MSGFIGAAMPVNHIAAKDERNNRQDFRREALFADMQADAVLSFETLWWPRGGAFIGEASGYELEASWWGEYDQCAGAAMRFGFTGVTRDSMGSPIGGVTIKLFRTSDDALIDSTVSDPLGNFLLNTAYYPDTHYLVAHKSGSPDVDGASVNTLIGS